MAARAITAAALRALSGNSEDEFENIRTRRTFRRPCRHRTTPKRGRKSSGVFKRRTLLLRRSNCDYGPIRNECENLSAHGLGNLTTFQ